MLVASPVVSIGGTQPVLLGVALTALTVCFLWLERLPLRPGLGIAGMLALALAGALPLASAANKEEPWFDYKAFAEGLGPDDPLQFNWGHSYGPITWPRDGAEVLRVASQRPSYWKVADLDDFDGETWIDSEPTTPARPTPRTTSRATGRRGRRGADAARDAAADRDVDVVGAGTTLGVEDTSRGVVPVGRAGLWRADTLLRGRRLLHGQGVRPAADRPSSSPTRGRGTTAARTR